MPTFFLPLTVFQPDFHGEAGTEPFRVSRRDWNIDLFDLATLASRHKLHMPYEAMSVLLREVNCELAVTGDISHLEAVDMARSFRAALYAQRLSPAVVPYVASHSINAYAGINARDGDRKVPDGLAGGITSRTDTVEVWPVELSLSAWRIFDRAALTESNVLQAQEHALRWREMAKRQKSLVALERALVASPLIAPIEQSILHLWSALEALFPKVSTEVVFRIALYVAQLVEGPRSGDRRAYALRVRNAYNLRSRITHGSVIDVEPETWIDSWDIACDVYGAVQTRGELPSEDELEDEALS